MLCILCLIMELSNNLRLKIVPLSDSNLLFFLINFICSFSGLKKALSQSEGSFPSFRQSSFVLFEINPISFSGVISCGYSSVSKEVITWVKKTFLPHGPGYPLPCSEHTVFPWAGQRLRWYSGRIRRSAKMGWLQLPLTSDCVPKLTKTRILAVSLKQHFGRSMCWFHPHAEVLANNRFLKTVV